jgi:hypothetical protein
MRESKVKKKALTIDQLLEFQENENPGPEKTILDQLINSDNNFGNEKVFPLEFYPSI